MCRNNGSAPCTIDSKSWRSCQKCRFDKCLEAGMKVEMLENRINKKAGIVKAPVDLFSEDETMTLMVTKWL